MIHKVFISRHQTCFVLVEAPSSSAITEEAIAAAIAETVTDCEWATDYAEHGRPVEVSSAEGWPVYQAEAPAPPAKSLTARAKEIGVSIVSLRKWRDERGIAIFDDEAVKRHIASQRNHSFKIAAKFKASLSR